MTWASIIVWSLGAIVAAICILDILYAVYSAISWMWKLITDRDDDRRL